MAPIPINPTSYCGSWSLSSEGWSLLGQHITGSGVGATRSSNTVTFRGLTTGSEYWLQVTASDGSNVTPNTVSLTGFTQVAGSSIISYESNYCAILAGLYKAGTTPKVTTNLGYSSGSNGIVSISIVEVTSL